jgi:hypothetical protein
MVTFSFKVLFDALLHFEYLLLQANRFCNITNMYLYDNGVMYQMDFISRCTLLNVVNHFQTLVSKKSLTLYIQ